MKSIIIENQLLPPISIYSIFVQSKNIIIEKHDNYNKRTYRNRFIINSSTGPQMISIPLKKGKNQLLYKDVKISYDNDWVKNIKKTLKTCYGSAPFFDFIYEDIIQIFEKRYKYLFDMNTEFRNYINDFLEIDTIFDYTQEYKKAYDSKIIDLRDSFLPAHDLKSIVDGKNMSFRSIFEEKENLIKNPSILDLLFNMGKYSFEVLENLPLKVE